MQNDGLIFFLRPPAMDRSFRPSVAPAFAAATGSTKAGNRERKSRGNT
jgi:hypothetical protein